MQDSLDPEKYAEQSRKFIRQAEEEFRRGDLVQASEKGWGAAATAAKSVAAQRGWRHHSHQLLYAVAAQIADELDPTDLDNLFRSASSLDTNSWENWMGERHVRGGGGIDDAAEFLREMEMVRNAPPPPFVPETPAQIARLRRLGAG